MADKAHKWTDKQIEKQEKELHKIYKTAERDLKEKLEKALSYKKEELDAMYSRYKTLLKSDLEEANKILLEYKKAREQITFVPFYKNQIKAIADDISTLNERALSYLNNEVFKVFRYNYNYSIKQVSDIVTGISFNLVSEDAVKAMYKAKKIRLPIKYLNRKKDVRWNTKKINSQILQSILQGESIDKTADRLRNVMDTNEQSSMRNARTMMTSAQNIGRQESYEQLERDGLALEKIWMSTADRHTRRSHLELDGQRVGIHDYFETIYGNKLFEPGDINGAPEEVFNCRCTMVSEVIGYKMPDGSIKKINFERPETTHEIAIRAEKEKRFKEEKQNAKG